MKSYRSIATAVALLVALSGLAPSVAAAGTLLSGYGGPGQGNQVILGGTLLGGEGPSGGGTETPALPAGGGESVIAAPGSGGTARTGVAGRRGGAPAGHVRPAGRRARNTGAGRPNAVAQGAAGAAVASPALGLTGRDQVFVLLVLAGLILTAALTRWIARGADAKGLFARPRRGM